jgi:hypothetical protein
MCFFSKHLTRVAAATAVLVCVICLASSMARAIELTNLELVFQKSRRCIGLPADTLNLWGRSVSTAGDVNGDGYDDIIVAAAWDEIVGPDPWLSMGFIFFGGDPMDTIPDVILTGDHDGEARVEVSYAGDVNADGFSDVVMSNHGDEAVRVFFGGDPMDTLYDVLLQNEFSRSFANSIDYAGDVNGDGYDDIVVGDYMDDLLNGSVAVFFGGPGLGGQPDTALNGHLD